MSTVDKGDWLVAESLVEPEDAFVLWMLDRGLCRSHSDFRMHFGEQFPLNDVIDGLAERGFVMETDGELGVTDLARSALTVLEGEQDFDLQEMMEIEIQSPLFRTLEGREGMALSLSEDIWHSAVALQEPTSHADEPIREYLLLRVSALLLVREGLFSVFAEMMKRFWPPRYHRSLSIMAINKALLTSPEHAFELSRTLLQFVIDPALLGMAADLAGRLNRIEELEHSIRNSKYVDRFRQDLDVPEGDSWTYAYLERLGLQDLAKSLRNEWHAR